MRETTAEGFARRPLQWVRSTGKCYTVRCLVGFSVGMTAKTIPQCVPSAGGGAGTVRFGGFVQWGTPLEVSHGASLQRVPSAGKSTAGSPPNSNTRARRPRPSPKRPIPVASDVRPPFSWFLQRARAPRASPDGPAKLENVDPSRLRHTSPPPTTTKSEKSIPIAPNTSSCFFPARGRALKLIPVAPGVWFRCRVLLGISLRPSRMKINRHQENQLHT